MSKATLRTQNYGVNAMTREAAETPSDFVSVTDKWPVLKLGDQLVTQLRQAAKNHDTCGHEHVATVLRCLSEVAVMIPQPQLKEVEQASRELLDLRNERTLAVQSIKHHIVQFCRVLEMPVPDLDILEIRPDQLPIIEHSARYRRAVRESVVAFDQIYDGLTVEQLKELEAIFLRFDEAWLALMEEHELTVTQNNWLMNAWMVDRLTTVLDLLYRGLALADPEIRRNIDRIGVESAL